MPRMEYERIHEQLAAMKARAEVVAIHYGKPTASASAEELFFTGMRSIAELLLPEFCFDTPPEEQCRKKLVQDSKLFIPKLLQPLWRAEIEKLLHERCATFSIW